MSPNERELILWLVSMTVLSWVCVLSSAVAIAGGLQ